MTQIKLSHTQERTLNKLAKAKCPDCKEARVTEDNHTCSFCRGTGYGVQSAYDLQESLSTLRSLCRLGLAESNHPAGSLFSPRTAIEFRISRRGVTLITLRQGGNQP